MEDSENNSKYDEMLQRRHLKRVEPAFTLRRHGIPCVIWAEDALQYYGSRTIHFDLFLLVADLQAATECLSAAEYSRALGNPRYEFIPELHELPRFKKGAFSEIEDDTATYVVLIQASRVYYALPPVDPTATAAMSEDDLWLPLPAFIDSILDAWLDAKETFYAAYLACYLGYLHRCSARARDPLLIMELKPGHRHLYRSFLMELGFGSRRPEWKEVRDSVAPYKAKTP